jgi:hypothetical protein
LKRKIKSFFEDFLIIIVLITVIYGSYSYFFDDSKDSFEQTQVLSKTEDTKTEIKEITQDEAIKDVITDENPDIENRTPPVIVQNNLEENIDTQKTTEKQNSENEKISEVKKDEITTAINNKQPSLRLLENSKLEKSASEEEQVEKEKFYKNLKDKIYSNIDKNIDKLSFSGKKSVDIRVTILKDGRYEQLIMTKGDEEFFNSIKSSILEVFPLEINQNLKNIFPRYYRLTIELN